MKKVYLLGLAMAGLAAGVYVQGCGSGTGTDGGGGTICHTDTDCTTGQLCDTVSGQCMQSCTQGSDCPSTEKTCIKNNTSNTVCTCIAGTNTCGTGFVCNSVDLACQQSCTSDANCGGYATTRHCDTATGECLPSTSNTDGGADGGGGGSCGAGTLCPSGSYCDTNSSTCVAGTACTVTNSQDVCPAGSACFDGTPAGSAGPICSPIGNPEGTCSISNPPATDPSSAPVVWGVTKTGQRTLTSSEDPSSCNSGLVDQFAGYYYDATNQIATGTTGATYYNIIVVDSSGSTTANGTTLLTYHNTAINTDGTFSFELCTDDTGAAGVLLQDNCSSSGCTGPQSNTVCLPGL